MQTISPELAKKLKELGVEQNGYAAWFFNATNLDKKPYVIPKTDLSYWISDSIEVYSAFTMDEILERLPKVIKKPCYPEGTIKARYDLIISFCGNDYSAGYICFRCKSCDDRGFHMYIDKNPAEAAGELLVWCIENDITTAIGESDERK